MKHTRMIFSVTALVGLVLAGILLVRGCDRKPRIGRASAAWQTRAARRQVHGIDDGAAYFGRYQDGNAIVVWVDSMGCGFPIDAGWDKTRKCAKYAGYVKSVSGHKVSIECYVHERMKGSMTINGQEYDLADGSLFLIAFRSPEIRVGQIDQDIFNMKMGEARRQLVEDVPEIRAFFEAPAKE